MAFSVKAKNGKTYSLYQNKKNSNLRYFSGKKSSKGKPIDVPPGMKVIENKRTGLPMLKRVGKAPAAKPATRRPVKKPKRRK